MRAITRSFLLAATRAFTLPAWALCAALVFAAGPASAQATAPAPAPTVEPKPDDSNAQRAVSQPGNNAPFWRAVRESGNQSGLTSLPGAEKGTLVQSFVQYPGSRYTTAGEAWRQVRNNRIIPYGAALLALTVAALAMFYFAKGPIGGHLPDTGRKIERFTPFERGVHWANAISFVVLAVSGLVMAFGKYVLLPVLGVSLFGWLTYVLKTLHNFAGPVFTVTLLVVILVFIRDNVPRPADWRWLRRAGGAFGGEEVPSHRFNGGEKLLFWGGVIFLGVAAVVSGLYLDELLPNMNYVRGNMQVAHIIHASAAVLMMAAFIGHIYMGTIGTRGAYQAMRHGYVDEAWAREHHALWYEDIQAGRIPAQRSGGMPSPAVRMSPDSPAA